MCQISLIDFDDARLSRFAVRPLTEINTLGVGASSNNDGFGYVCFTNLDKIYKTKNSAQSWWQDHTQEFRKRHRNTNGIYHVRACSVSQRTKTEEEHSHPFNTDNLVLVHNGTLSERYASDNRDEFKELIDNKLIDSANFLLSLDYIVENDDAHACLTAENIHASIDEWNGSFVFLMADKRNPKSIYLATDDEKHLHRATFRIGKKKVGMIINTMKFELRYVCELIVSYAEALDIKLSFEIEEFDEDKIWIYQHGSYKIDDPIMEINRKPSVNKVVNRPNPNMNNNVSPIQRPGPHGKYAPFERAANSIFELRLTYFETVTMSELLFGQNFFTFNDDMMVAFADFLEQLLESHKKIGIKGRIKSWNNAKGKKSMVKLYTKGKIMFPFFLNSNKTIKKATKHA